MEVYNEYSNICMFNISWRDCHALFNLINILKQDGLSHEWIYMCEQSVLKLSLKIKYTPLLNIKNTILKIPEGSHRKLALWVGLQTDVMTLFALLEIGFIKILLECSSGIVTCAKFLLGDIGCLKQTMYVRHK